MSSSLNIFKKNFFFITALIVLIIGSYSLIKNNSVKKDESLTWPDKIQPTPIIPAESAEEMPQATEAAKVEEEIIETATAEGNITTYSRKSSYSYVRPEWEMEQSQSFTVEKE